MGSITDFVNQLGGGGAAGGGGSPPTAPGTTPGPVFVPPAFGGPPPSSGPITLTPGTRPLTPGEAQNYQGGGVGANQGDQGGLAGLPTEGFHLVAGVIPGLFHFGARAVHDASRQLVHDIRDPLDTHPLKYDPQGVGPQLVQSFKRSAGRVTDFAASLAPGGEAPSQSQYGQAFSHGHLLGALTEDLANAATVASLGAATPLEGAASHLGENATVAREAADAAAKASEEAAAAHAAAHEAASVPGAGPVESARFLQTQAAASAAAEHASALEAAAQHAEQWAQRTSRVASTAKSFSKLTGQGANAPFLPIAAADKIAGALFGGFSLPGPLAALHYGAPFEGLSGLGEAGAEQGLRHPIQALGDIGRGVQHEAVASGQKSLARNLIQSAKLGTDKILGPIKEYGKLRSAVYTDPIDEAAHSLLMQGQVHAAAGPYERAISYGQADAAERIAGRVAAETGTPVEAVHRAFDSLDTGNTHPDVVAFRQRMGEADQLYAKQQAGLVAAHLAGHDVPGGIATPEQIAKAHADVNSTEAFGATPEERLNPDNAPARYRPMLRIGAAVSDELSKMAAEAEAKAPGSGFGFDQLKHDAITTLQQAVDAGVNPAHVIGGVVKPGQSFRNPGTELPRVSNSGATKYKGGYSQPVTVHDQTVLMARRAHAIAQDAGARMIQQFMGHTAADLGVTETNPAKIEAAMAEQHYVAWNPATGERLPTRQITPETPFIPSPVFRTFRSHYREFDPAALDSGIARGIIKGSDVGNRIFKAGVLYLSPRWIFGHTIGHTILEAAAGLGPHDMIYYGNHARLVQTGGDLSGLSPAERSLLPEGKFVPPTLGGRGQAASDLRPEQFTPGGKGSPQGFVGNAVNDVRHPIQTSQAVVGFSDNLNRLTVALAKADKGMTPELEAAFRADHPDLAGLPKQELTNEWAVRQSLHYLGDFSNLSAVERNVTSRLLLFYPWMKHITKLAFDLAVHDPLRVAWTLHLADLYGPHGLQLPLTQGKWALGKGWFANIPKTNPFDAPFNYFGATGSGSTPFASLNPVISLAGSAAGFNTSKLSPSSAPAGFGPLNAYGSGQSLGPNPGAFARQLLFDSPQLSALSTVVPNALFGHAPVARYDTGQPIRIGHQDIAPDQQLGGNTLGPLLNLLGVGASKIDVGAIEARAEAKRKAAAAARKSYGKVLPGRAP